MADKKQTCARDLMSEDLVTLHEDTPVTEAIATLEEYHFSGAPVVNDLGECVGVFTSSDFLKQRREIEEGETPRAGGYFSIDPLSEDNEEYFSRDEYDVELLGQDTVGQWMTPVVRFVTPRTPIEEICKRMTTERIHRVLVMEKKRLLGIVTSFDIVRLMAGQSAARRSVALKHRAR